MKASGIVKISMRATTLLLCIKAVYENCIETIKYQLIEDIKHIKFGDSISQEIDLDSDKYSICMRRLNY